MSDAQVVEMSITTTKNSLSQDFTKPNDRRSSGFCSCNPSWLVMLLINISSHSDIVMIQDPMLCLLYGWHEAVVWLLLYTHLSALDHPWWWHLTGVSKHWVLNYCNFLTCVHSNQSNANMTVHLVSAWTVIYISRWYLCIELLFLTFFSCPFSSTVYLTTMKLLTHLWMI